MPLIVCEAGQMRPEIKAELLRRLTDVSAEVTGIPKEPFFVTIHEWPDADIAVDGRTVADIKARLTAQPRG